MHKKFFVLLFCFVLSFSSIAEENKDGTYKGLPSTEITLDNNMFANMLPKTVQLEFTKILKDNPFRKMSRDQLKSFLESMMKGQKIEGFIKKNPKLLDGFVNWLQHEKALPSFVSIINKPKKMKTYSMFFIAVFIISFLLNLKNSESGLLGRIFRKFLIFIGATSTNIVVFYVIFKNEVGPTIEVIKNSI